MFIRVSASLVAIAALIACSTGSPGPEQEGVLGPSPLADIPRTTVPTGGIAAVSPTHNVVVNMQDNCDGDSFNAVIGSGTCVRSGGLKFEDFIAHLTQFGVVPSWRFAPINVSAREGQEFHVINHGGEVHTFTEVEEFGGGIVPNLNALAHTPVVAPECLALEPDDFVAPGATYEEDIEEAGVEKYQCCIHPWMRLTAHVSESH